MAARRINSQVAAVFLLRLLAWRRVVGIVRPAGPNAEPDEALRYVFVSGLPGAGAGMVYQFLTGMPIDTKVYWVDQFLRHNGQLCIG
jgi:hypothetical protein